jgi:hypothetical protein
MSDKVRYLHIFIDRFVAQPLTDRYPNYHAFVNYFLKFLEQQNDGVFYYIENLINFSDIDAIIDMKNSTDPDKQELGDKLIYEIYEQMVGSKNTRYLSSLLDEEIYLKRQKGILRSKGTKSSFLFFFLIVLGGYFRILNVTSSTKKHDGVFLYNGLITYNYLPDGIDPYIYVILSEFYPTQYDKILNALNPAGMYPIPFYINLKYIYDSTPSRTPSYITDHNDVYIVYYNGLTPIGALKPQRFGTYDPILTENYDIELVDNTHWIESTGSQNYYIEVVFNVPTLGDVDINNFTINYGLMVTGAIPAVNNFYTADQILSYGTQLYDQQYITDQTGEVIRIINNIRQQIMIEYTG